MMSETKKVTIYIPADHHRRLMSQLAEHGEKVSPLALRLLDQWCMAQQRGTPAHDDLPPMANATSKGPWEDLLAGVCWIMEHGDRQAMVSMVAMVAMVAPSSFLETGRPLGRGPTIQGAAVDLADAVGRYLDAREGTSTGVTAAVGG